MLNLNKNSLKKIAKKKLIIFFSTLLELNSSSKNINKPTSNIVISKLSPLVPIVGINQKPVTNVPNILPIVEYADILPDISPILSLLLSHSICFNFTENGETNANTKLGNPNNNTDIIIAVKTNGSPIPANGSKIKTSN